MISRVDGRTCCELCGWYFNAGDFRIITVNEADGDDKEEMAVCVVCIEKLEAAR